MNERERSIQQAIALRYDRARDGAPRVVASGRGVIAENIIERARQCGIQIHEDPDLLELLGAIDVYDLIPPEAYRAVAELLAFLYRVNKQMG